MNRNLEALANQMRLLGNFGGADAMSRQLHASADALCEAHEDGREEERKAAIAYFEKVAAETEDQSPAGKAHWSKAAAQALRDGWHLGGR